MIDNERLKNLSEHELEQIAGFYDDYECYARPCTECPFELDKPYVRNGFDATCRCALVYARVLYRRLVE